MKEASQIYVAIQHTHLVEADLIHHAVERNIQHSPKYIPQIHAYIHTSFR